MEFDIFTFLCGVGLGAFAGYRIADHIHKSILPDLFHRAGVTPEKLERVMEELKKEIGQEEETESGTEINIKVEQHGEQIYVFRKDNDEFLGQGRNYDEILKILQSKFKDVKFAVSEEDGAGLLGLKNSPTS